MLKRFVIAAYCHGLLSASLTTALFTALKLRAV